jgi:hypothetical protein
MESTMSDTESTSRTCFKVAAVKYPGFYATQNIEADSLDEAVAKAKSHNWDHEPFKATDEWPPVQTLLVESEEESHLIDLQPSGDAALSLLRRLIEDVRSAFGTGSGDAIDAIKLDWPDLAVTYHEAVAILSSGTPTRSSSTLFAAIYEHNYGTDVRVFREEAQALAWRTELAKEWWDSEFSDSERPAHADIGAEYFDRMRDGGDEFFTIECCSVE